MANWNPFKKKKSPIQDFKNSIADLGAKIPKGVKRAGLYGLGAVGVYYGAKAAMHASVLKTDDPRYKALRKSEFLDDKEHKKQLAYWKKRNA
jgi:hypothetical protein